MYHLSVTSKQHRLHTVVSASLWEVHDDGTREQVRLASVFIPEPNGGIFGVSPAEFLDQLIQELKNVRDTWQDLPE